MLETIVGGVTVVIIGALILGEPKSIRPHRDRLILLSRNLVGRNARTYDHNLPYPPLGNLLKGRNHALSGLGSALGMNPGNAVISQPKTIHGVGGVGKTRLAVEFAWKELRAKHCTAVYFVRGDSPEHLDAQLATLFPRLYPGHATPQMQSDAIEAVVGALIARKDWLVIIDNVDQIDAREHLMKAYLPRLTGGHILITSRLADWSPNIFSFTLERLSEKAAVAYLLEKTKSTRTHESGDKSAARDLAHYLDHLPIALEQAAAYIINTKSSVRAYLDKVKDSPVTMFEKRIEGTTNHPSSVLRVWETTEDQLTPGAKAILTLASFLAPEPIPRALFQDHPELIAKAIPNFYTVGFAPPIPPDDSTPDIPILLGELARWSMINLDTTNFTIHRLTQDTTRLRIEEAQFPALLDTALTLLNNHLPNDPPPYDVRSWSLWETMETLVQAAVGRYTDSAEQSPKHGSRLMNDLGLYLFARARFTEAKPLYQRALEIDEAAYGENHLDVARDLNNLATLLQATNRFDEAEPLIRRALAIEEAAYGENHPDVAICLNNLAQLLHDTNRLDEAEPMMRRALEIDEASFGENHPNVAIRLVNLARLLQATDRLDEAEPMMRRALEIDEAAYGENHPRVGIDLNNLAQLLQDTNRLDQAEPMMRRALEIEEAAHVENHPNVAIRLNNLARLLQATNRLDEAEPMMRRALAIDEAAYGKNHPQVAIYLNNLAQLLQNTNRLDEAEPMMQRALEIEEASYGEDHPKVAIRLNNLALLFHATNRLAKAEPLARRAWDINRISLGDEHPRTQIALQNLQGIKEDLGKKQSP